MREKFTGRRALVSGSSGGIGEAIAGMLAQEGCVVVVHGRNRERAAKGSVVYSPGAVKVVMAQGLPVVGFIEESGVGVGKYRMGLSDLKSV